MSDDIRALERDLGRASADATRGVIVAIGQTLHDIKTTARAEAPSWSGRYARSISYDHAGLRGEVGPEERWGHLVEDGGARSAPNPVMARATKANERKLDERIAEAAFRSLGW